MKELLTLVCCALVLVENQSVLWAQPAGYAYGKQITINASQVGGSLSQFPLLMNLTDSDLRSVSNGGNVENANGYDLVFYMDDCVTPLSHQIEKYVATSGQYIAWVQLPTLDNSANTEIILFYGNNSVTADPSTNSIWGGYGAVWHFSGNSLADATANGNNGTNSGTTNAAGKIGDGRSFSPMQFISVPNHSSLNVTTSFTFQAWVNPVSLSGILAVFAKINSYILGINYPQGAANALNCWLYNGGPLLYDAGTVSTGQWTHAAATFDGNSVHLYLNGSLVGSASRTLPVATTNDNFAIGWSGGSGYFSGMIDEPRISPIALDAAWLLTEYNNQNNPSSFYSVSAEMTAAEACGLVLPVELISFTAQPNENEALLSWRTASETNNFGFYVEKSTDGRQFQNIGFVAGSGHNLEGNRYTLLDENFHASAYYRLRQMDFDGVESFSNLVFLAKQQVSGFAIYPNPTSDVLFVEYRFQTPGKLFLYLQDVAGCVAFFTEVSDAQTDVAPLQLDGLLSGVYVLKIKHPDMERTERVVVQRP